MVTEDGRNAPAPWVPFTRAGCDFGAVGTANTVLENIGPEMAPAFYLHGDPSRDDPVTRKFEHDLAAVKALNPYTGKTRKINRQMIDEVGMKLLHMVTGDPLRTPTFVSFLDPDFFGFGGAPDCSSPCVQVQPGFAWNHGGLVPEVAATWVGLAGPGVRKLGETGGIWADHTDLRPTILTLVGLEDDYVHDGRVLLEALRSKAQPQSLRAHRGTLIKLGFVYKQINAPFGRLGRKAIRVSTAAIKGDDARYARLEAGLADLTGDRDAVAAQMRNLLERAAFAGERPSQREAKRLLAAGLQLLERAEELAASVD